MTMFKPATREKLKLRMAIDGPSGSGKTYTALRFGFGLVDGDAGRVAVIDTEHRAASKYQGEAPDGIPWTFDVCELVHFAPTAYAAAIKEAGQAGYDVLIVDSLSHAWEGIGGALDLVDQKGGNKFTAWKDVTPLHRSMIEAILASPCHVIATMRTKTEYILEEETNKQGKTIQVPKKIGMAPIQRSGTEYEFDVVADMDLSHTLSVSKTRCPAMDGQKSVKPDAGFIAPLKRWLSLGAEPKPNGHAEVEVPPPVNTQDYTERLSAPCPEDYRRRILDILKAGTVTKQFIQNWIKNVGKAKVAELTIKQAEQLITACEQQESKTDTPF